MKEKTTIIRDNHTFISTYQQLGKNDIIVGRLRLRPGEEHILVDLQARGVRLIPSASAQLASRSKVFQTRILSDFLPPDSLAIYDIHGLLRATSAYRKNGHRQVILKHDRKNGGVGVHFFESIEDLYNMASTAAYPLPFVVQPCLSDSRDIRVIVIGDYHEAYERSNPFNFRQNLHCGGTASPCALSERQLAFCRKVMERGQFPYAHIDLLLTTESEPRLLEINLRGGLRGAKIKGPEYLARVEAMHHHLLAGMLDAG